jgi:hypothetical protein
VDFIGRGVYQEIMAIKCKLICPSSKYKLTQLFAGFGLLEKASNIQLELEQDKNYLIGYKSKEFLKVVLNNEIKMIYDTSDGDAFFQDELAWCDLYFKKSYDPEQVNSLNLSKKVLPLGFYYTVYGPNDHLALRNSWAISNLFKQRSYKETAFQILRYDTFFSRLFKINSGRYLNDYRNYERLPRFDLEPKVVFFTKLWDPNKTHSNEIKMDRMQINEMRAGCVRQLKNQFQGSFLGGLEINNYTQKTYPDLVVEHAWMTKKEEYLRQLDRAVICIATSGLHGAHGRKLGEYIAGSKAIVSEKIRYLVPGDFDKGKNYLEFSTADECVEMVTQLMENKEKRNAMMRDNFTYYNNYLRPDMLVWNTLMAALKFENPIHN